MILKAVEHIAPLRGGSQAQIMRANNGAYFAVKFQDNPQHTACWPTNIWPAAWRN
jgi:hypothetical protein